ncbi:Uu.00g095550.m01.CDS01 [Anthostomella pinea]|uniref:Uu.00g095550.m01.CDS01 n=1 Tax=Anthostomella pinea TaxID=933095 RepID=A0AAI8VC38_9PEZI|nr:Uu.00g095550.m01.CDS01 [Anthostomella pinea]
MTDREDSDTSQPRKRIAVACGRCRKRKIRCSGDPGNGGPCSNCKSAGYEPCLFLRVSSTETHLRNEGSDYGYNLDAARTYANQTRGAVSPLNPLSHYAADLPPGDVLSSYRQSPYPYSSKNYYSTMAGWQGAYPDDGVDYGLNYPSYQMLNQDSAPLVQGYGRYGSSKPVYVDSESPSYSYGSLVHRPAVNSDSQGFSLSSMAASLPSASDRVISSDRLHSEVNRTLTGSSMYRADGLLTHYGGTKPSPTSTIPEVGYNNPGTTFESPYSASSTLPSGITQRTASQADTAAYQASAGAAADTVYPSGDQTLRPAEDANAGLSYVYSDSKLDNTRRGSRSRSGAGAGSVLSNGHVYVPESHHTHAPPQSYVVPSSSASQASGRGGPPTPAAAGSRVRGTSHTTPSDVHRRSAGSLRGG